MKKLKALSAKKFKVLCACGVTAGALVVAPSTASAQIVANGLFTDASSFSAHYGYSSTSMPTYNNGMATVPNPNPAEVMDWTGTGYFGAGTSTSNGPFQPSGYYNPGDMTTPADPINYVFLQQNGASLYQTLTGLVAGQTYELSFYSGPRENQGHYGGNDDGSAEVTISNTTLAVVGAQATTTSGTFNNDPMLDTLVDPDFTLTTVDFVATASGNSVITLLNTSIDGDNTEDFANVVITLVPTTPEPTTWALMLSGLGALAIFGGRRQLKAQAIFR